MNNTIETVRNKSWRYTLTQELKRNWQLYLLVLFPLVYVIIFEYAPMYGLQIAFRDYRAKLGITGSEWVGLANFRDFFKSAEWTRVVGNTLRLSLYSILVGFPIPIILALMIHVSENKVLKKLTQNVSYIPHFISVVVLVGIINQIFNPFTGMWAAIQKLLGLNISSDIRSNPDAFIHLYTWSGVWQSMGWNSIVYVSALSAVSQDLHEAAMLDGASRWRRVLSVDIPAIMPTICIMLILRFGNVMSVGFEKVFLMQNTLNRTESEVISTYVYTYGLGKNNLSFGTAVSLMNSVINTGMLLLVNWITSKLSDDEMSLL